ncbi:MAG: sugar phosphate nucleotidyltransferase, partial [Cyanobacteria bacterium J06648_11]
DFGKEVIPAAMNDFRVQAYLFEDYWEDIGTIESFYKANLNLVKQPAPAFSFYDAEAPIFTRPRFLPPNKILGCTIQEGMIADGCIVKDGSIVRNSIVGIRSRIESNVTLEDTLVMGADFYQSPEARQADRDANIPPVGIGEGTHIRRAIVDKNTRIGKNVRILNKDNVQEAQREELGFWISNGITIVVRGGTIPDNTVI